MRLNLDHVLSLSEILTPLAIGTVLGCLVLALLVLAFTHRWWGLITGIVLLSVGIGFAAVIGLQLKANTSTTQTTEVLNSNADRVRTWAGAAYKLQLSTAQAKTLATGTESYPAPADGSQQFGTITGVTIEVTGGSVAVPVTLFYTKGTWTLAYTNASGAYTRIPVQP